MRQQQLLTSREAQPFRRQHRAPCSDCPWARKSLPGWIGSNSVAQWLAVARDGWHPIACHTRRIASEALRDVEAHRTSEACQGHWECAGAAIYRANTSVMFYPERRWLTLPPNRIAVFATPGEFIAHHQGVKA